MRFFKAFFPDSSQPDSLGICLSGGAALGFAHIGVLQALEDHGIFPQHIAGSSMGAVVGALYAAGIAPHQMLEMTHEQKWYKISKMMTIRPINLGSGISKHQMLRLLIRDQIPHNSFEGLQKKLYVCVANISKSQWEIIHQGDHLDKWIAASASIPGLFEAIKMNDMYYVDGALLNNLPAQALEDECNNIIGVDVIPHVELPKTMKPMDTLMASVRTMQHNNSSEGRNLCRFIIEPRGIDAYSEFSFDSYQAIYDCGYEATLKCIAEYPEIKLC